MEKVVIYLIMGAAYLIFEAYKKAQKNKPKKTYSPSPENTQRQANPRHSTTVSNKTLDELLRENLEEDKIEFEVEDNPIKEEVDFDSLRFNKSYDYASFQAGNIDSDSEKPKKQRSKLLKNFDLKQAIIQSTILNRPKF